MLTLLLCIVVAQAAVIPNTTSGDTTRTTTIVTALPATAPSITQTVTTSIPTDDGAWTYDFPQFISLGSQYDPPSETPRATTPLSHLYPEMYRFYALSRLPEKPFIGLASPYDNSYAVAHGHTDADANLRAQCSTSFEASLSPFLETAPIAILTIYPQSTDIYTTDGFTGPTRVSYSQVSTTAVSDTYTFEVYSAVPTTITRPAAEVNDVYAEWTLWTYETPFTYSASGDCCWTCTIVGGTHVQVNYWPKTADPAPVASIVDEKGFTFVSPSVYVAFETLYATNLCGNVGPTYGATTLAFGVTELSTARAYRWDTTAYATAPPLVFQTAWTQADWGDQVSCANTEKEFYQYITYKTFENLADLSSEYLSDSRSSTLASTNIHHYTITWNNCSPSLSVPTEILTLNSDWKDCSQGLDGIYDPPYPLKPQAVLVPTTSADSDPVTSPTTEPTEGPTVIPPTPTPTAEPITEDPKPTPTPDPPVETPNDPTVSPTANDPVETPKPEDPVETPKPEDPAETPKPQDPVETPKPQDPVETPKPQDPVETPKPQDPAEIPRPQDPAESPKPQDPVETPKASDPVTNDPATQKPPTQNPPTQPKPTTVAGVITIGSSTIVAGPSSDFVIDTQTLAPGSQIIASGTTFSLATDGASLVVDGSTVAISRAPVIRPTGYVVGSQTIAAGGPAVTVSGVEVSMASDASSVVVGDSTMPLSEYLGATATTAEALGSVIASFGGFGTDTSSASNPENTFAQVTSTPGYNGTMFTGGASGVKGDVWVMGIIVAVGVMVVGLL